MSAMPPPLRVFFVDIDTLLSRKLQLYSDVLLLPCDPTDSTALQHIAMNIPDVVLMSLTEEQHPQRIALIRQIRATMPHAQVVVITSQISLILDALYAGAIGYSCPAPTAAMLYQTIQDAVRQRGTLTADVARHILRKHRKQLTSWEQHVLRSLSEGKTLEEIAQILDLPVIVLQRHIGNVFAKLAQPLAYDACVEAHRLINQADNCVCLSLTVHTNAEVSSEDSQQRALQKWKHWEETVKTHVRNTTSPNVISDTQVGMVSQFCGDGCWNSADVPVGKKRKTEQESIHLIGSSIWRGVIQHVLTPLRHNERLSEPFRVISLFHPPRQKTRRINAHRHARLSDRHSVMRKPYPYPTIRSRIVKRSPVPPSGEIIPLVSPSVQKQAGHRIFPHAIP